MPLPSNELEKLVNIRAGEIDRRIFTDEEIFEMEMREIFGRAWLFLCHETQIPKPGDFFEAPMGRDNVLVIRQKDYTIRALLNTCTHRGNAVCRAEEGNTKNFMCTYHGWTFNLAGDLIGVPGMEDYYKGKLDKSTLGLRRVAQLESYKGFVFGTFDPEAPPLHDYLGPTGRLGLDLLAEHGDLEIVPGVQKFVLDCNWKFTVDNLFDWYHPQITHMSAAHVGIFPEDSYQSFLAAGGVDSGGVTTPDGKKIRFKASDPFDRPDSIVVLGEYGHAIAGPPVELRSEQLNEWRRRPGVADVLGPIGMRSEGHPNIFPTCWVTLTMQISLRIPRSVNSTEIWWFSFTSKKDSPEMRNVQKMLQNHIFGPSGILEQEDGENWVQSTMQAAGDISATIPQALRMNVGQGEIQHEHGLSFIEGKTNEHAQLWTYGAWSAWLSGCDWSELRSRTIPGDKI